MSSNAKVVVAKRSVEDFASSFCGFFISSVALAFGGGGGGVTLYKTHITSACKGKYFLNPLSPYNM